MTKLRPFFTYFGGKWRAAKHYPRPKYRSIIEPFAGSAGYSLHYPENKVKLFDVDPIICSVWDYLIKVTEEEFNALPSVVADVRDLVIPQEAKYIIGFWLNKGSASPRNVPGSWMRSQIRPTSFWGDSIKNRISTQLQYIRHWSIQNRSYASIDNEECTWFIDPPYFTSGKHYRFNKLDYNHLGEWCKERSGQIIVCEQEGSTWLPFTEFRNIQALRGKRGSKISREVVWYK